MRRVVLGLNLFLGVASAGADRPFAQATAPADELTATEIVNRTRASLDDAGPIWVRFALSRNDRLDGIYGSGVLCRDDPSTMRIDYVKGIQRQTLATLRPEYMVFMWRPDKASRVTASAPEFDESIREFQSRSSLDFALSLESLTPPLAVFTEDPETNPLEHATDARRLPEGPYGDSLLGIGIAMPDSANQGMNAPLLELWVHRDSFLPAYVKRGDKHMFFLDIHELRVDRGDDCYFEESGCWLPGSPIPQLFEEKNEKRE